ncbi:hypothetical protein GCM10010389_64690 [Streptomyces echinoruber]|uniref:Uncharacterized protein n=1 Tax=Streptomyces echinoruber TaxID=68898 RepID=A0A918S285_9ACTN|nr:hypothetical protein GCM10010389_64690 [Streptomyces echinoruber]
MVVGDGTDAPRGSFGRSYRESRIGAWRVLFTSCGGDSMTCGGGLFRLPGALSGETLGNHHRRPER